MDIVADMILISVIGFCCYLVWLWYDAETLRGGEEEER